MIPIRQGSSQAVLVAALTTPIPLFRRESHVLGEGDTTARANTGSYPATLPDKVHLNALITSNSLPNQNNPSRYF